MLCGRTCFRADSVETFMGAYALVTTKSLSHLILCLIGGAATRPVTSYSCWCEPASHSSQVLSCCSHQELVSRPAYASQPQSIELQYAFEVGEQHLHLLPLLA